MFSHVLYTQLLPAILVSKVINVDKLRQDFLDNHPEARRLKISTKEGEEAAALIFRFQASHG